MPTAGSYPDTTSIIFLGYSDDPWQAAAVRLPSSRGGAAAAVQRSAPLESCLTTCDGCGHCGAGAPPAARAVCDARTEAFVQRILEPWAKTPPK